MTTLAIISEYSQLMNIINLILFNYYSKQRISIHYKFKFTIKRLRLIISFLQLVLLLMLDNTPFIIENICISHDIFNLTITLIEKQHTENWPY